MANFYQPKPKKNNLNQVFTIYIERLDYLMKISKIINQENWIFIDHRDLINDSDVILKKITAFLNLNKPLNGEYRCLSLHFWAWGKWDVRWLII